MSEINSVGAGASNVSSTPSTSSAPSETGVASSTRESQSTSESTKTEESKDSKNEETLKDKDKTEKNEEKKKLQEEIEKLKKELEGLKKELQNQPKGNCNSSRSQQPQQPQQPQQAQQAQNNPNQNQNDPNQLIIQDILAVLQAIQNGGQGLQPAVQKLKQDYMMVKSMNLPLKPEVEQMAQQILQQYGGGTIVNPMVAPGLNPTQTVNPLGNIAGSNIATGSPIANVNNLI